MTFLEGAFLAGIAGISIPIVIHLLHRRKTRPLRFPSLRFLQEVEVRTARRSRIVEWLILALRAAALLLLALALARPVLHEGPLGRGRATCVFVIDNSMSSGVTQGSMSALEHYRLITKKLLLEMEPADRGAVLPLHAPSDYVPALTESRKALERAVDDIAVTYRATPLVDAVRRAVGLLADDNNPIRRVWVLSDVQASAVREAEEGVEIPEGVHLHVLRPRLPRTPNVAFSALDVRGGGTGRRGFDARLRGYGAMEAQVRVAFAVDGKVVEERAVRVPPRGETSVRFAAPKLEPGLHRGQLRIQDDLLAADNTLSFGFTTGEPLRVLVVRDATVKSGAADPLFYLSRALVPRKLRDAPMRVQATTTEKLSSLDLSPFHVVFLAGTRGLDSGTGSALGRFVVAGGGLFISSGPAHGEDALRSLAVGERSLSPVTIGPLVRAQRAPIHLRAWKEDHPLFAPLVGTSPPLRPDVPLFIAYRKVTPAEGAQTIAEFDSGDPALVVLPAGMGKVVYFASTLTTEWSNLPLRFLFPPLVHSTVHYLAGSSYHEERHAVGVPLVLRCPRRPGFVGARVRYGDGETVRLRPDDALESRGTPGTEGAGEFLSFDLGAPEKPGLVVVTETYESGTRRRLISILPEPRESDLEPLPASRLREILPGSRVIEFRSEDEALRETVLLTAGSELKSPLLFLLLLLLLVEPLLANRSARRRPPDHTGVPA